MGLAVDVFFPGMINLFRVIALFSQSTVVSVLIAVDRSAWFRVSLHNLLEILRAHRLEHTSALTWFVSLDFMPTTDCFTP